MTPEQATVLGRIDERTASIKDSIDRHESAINELYAKTNENSRFNARVKGTTKGVLGGVGLVGALAGALAKAKGMF